MQTPSSYNLATLAGLQRKPHIYGGTVAAHVKAANRKANRAARKARRLNRKAK
jgi:hypothetical protein